MKTNNSVLNLTGPACHEIKLSNGKKVIIIMIRNIALDHQAIDLLGDLLLEVRKYYAKSVN